MATRDREASDFKGFEMSASSIGTQRPEPERGLRSRHHLDGERNSIGRAELHLGRGVGSEPRRFTEEEHPHGHRKRRAVRGRPGWFGVDGVPACGAFAGFLGGCRLVGGDCVPVASERQQRCR